MCNEVVCKLVYVYGHDNVKKVRVSAYGVTHGRVLCFVGGSRLECSHCLGGECQYGVI